MGNADGGAVGTMVGEKRNTNFHKTIHSDTDSATAGDAKGIDSVHVGSKHGVGSSHIADNGRWTATTRQV
jgi:hypothetical protein